MPFGSKSQLRTCYGVNDPRWNCDEWLKSTKSVCDLPEKVAKKKKTKRDTNNIITKGQILKGPRGGKYFFITEKTRSGKIVCQLKVYVSKK